jgi:sugar transferase (PEP-CTERM/EpsH1 system associated)
MLEETLHRKFANYGNNNNSPGNKRILYLVDNFAEGGAANVVFHLISALDKNRFVPVLGCLDGVGLLGERLKKAGVTVEFLARRPGLDTGLFGRIIRLIRKEKIDLIHAHQYAAFFYGSLAALSTGFRNILFTEHGRIHPDFVRPKRVMVNKLVIPFIPPVVAVSRSVQNSLVCYEKIPRKRIKIVVNGIDLKRFQTKGVRKVIRENFGISQTESVIAIVARLCDYKNHENLIRSLAIAHQKNSHIKLLIVGDGPMREELETLTGNLGLKSKVIFTSVRQDIPDILNAVDMVALCSYYEGTSITILEAMAAGKPVIASRIAGNPDVVKDQKTGILVSPDDPKEIAGAVIRLAGSPDLRKEMGQAGYRRCLKYYTVERMAGEYQNLYSRILEKH